jgi:hypothetical protein
MDNKQGPYAHMAPPIITGMNVYAATNTIATNARTNVQQRLLEARDANAALSNLLHLGENDLSVIM